MNRLISILLLLFILTSCFKEDKKIAPHTRKGNDSLYANWISVSTYKNQLFFDLSTNSVVAQNSKYIWDLGFESSPTGWHIVLNSSKFMSAANSGKTDFDAVTNISGLTFAYDRSSGNLDSTAISRWGDTTATPVISYNKVFVLDLGIDDVANPLGYKKIQFQKLENDKYYFHFANLDGTDKHSGSIKKDPNVSFVSYSFANGGDSVNFEPQKDKWDLLFTQYTANLKLNNIPYPYLVTGVFLNRHKVVANREMTQPFDSITYKYVTTKLGPLSHKRDTIGYAWKQYSRDKGRYTIVTNKYYVVKSVKDIYYRLRFTGFYNNSGDKGYPAFEFQKL